MDPLYSWATYGVAPFATEPLSIARSRAHLSKALIAVDRIIFSSASPRRPGGRRVKILLQGRSRARRPLRDCSAPVIIAIIVYRVGKLQFGMITAFFFHSEVILRVTSRYANGRGWPVCRRLDVYTQSRFASSSVVTQFMRAGESVARRPLFTLQLRRRRRLAREQDELAYN
ncbi:hypothetical protein EVAR_84797_1 [Eumeta japonica]|uniref:Uncharacterized protein n=1 Tax=Eumeta variegata TaxID=151549 RepID=A0A4C1U8W5_EUMVA|nr:hypothetical protein EVAR_84797_1 [Eumeta japonica]